MHPRNRCAVTGGIGPIWWAGRPAATRAAQPPNRAALWPNSGGPVQKSGRPPPKIGRPEGGPQFGAARHDGRRAAHRAATLKMRAARMWPPLGRWAAHGGRGAARVAAGRPATHWTHCTPSPSKARACGRGRGRRRHTAAQSAETLSHGRGGGGTRVPPGRCVRQHALRQRRRPPAWQTTLLRTRALRCPTAPPCWTPWP
mgnify:CR=1 FL=1